MDFKQSRVELTTENPLNAHVDKGQGNNKFGMRHVQAVLLFLCFFTNFFLRLNLSVGIVAMTDRNSSNPNFHEFDWDEPTKSAILSSFFWGYLVSQAPAGQLGQYVSPKLLLLLTNSLSGALTALIPWASYYGGWKLLCAFRVITGLTQGFMLPLSYNLASKWSPPDERNRFVGFSLNGGTLGATVAFPLCGLLASSAGGWPSIFYVSAALSFTWIILWFFLGADSPSTHPRISQDEKEFIQRSLVHTSNEVLKTPWKDIFTSVPVYALIAAQLGFGWGFSIVITEMPSYINSVLGFNIATNGLLSALPYLSMWLLTFPTCWLADYISKRQLLSNTTSRKMWTTFALAGGSVMMVSMGFVGRNAAAAITLLTLAVSLSACIFSGFNINHLDLAPNFAGVLMGICNGLENITTILAPLTFGWIVTDTTSVEQWRTVFIVTAAVSLAGNLLFIIFGTANIQPWNTPPKKQSKQIRALIGA